LSGVEGPLATENSSDQSAEFDPTECRSVLSNGKRFDVRVLPDGTVVVCGGIL
jgi:hypothetical protein